MALHASWSPGIAFMPAERPADGLQNVNNIGWTDVVGLRQSGGATFRGRSGNSNWFHVPIATPVIVNNVRAKLIQVFVMFQSGDPAATIASNAGANVTNVDVWDGARRIRRFGPFNLFGEHRFGLDTSNMFNLGMPRPDVFFGVALSVRVNFTQDQTVTFSSAGADFDV